MDKLFRRYLIFTKDAVTVFFEGARDKNFAPKDLRFRAKRRFGGFLKWLVGWGDGAVQEELRPSHLSPF